MSDIHEELKEIFRQALQAKSPQEQRKLRQKGMDKMHTAWASPKNPFWKGHPPQYTNDLLYIEAANITWDYIERKIYGKVRGGKAYDPDDGGGSPITLWNDTCKKKYVDRLKQESNLMDNAHPNTPYGIKDIQQPVSDTPRLELVRQEIENDPTGELRAAFVRQTPPPPITAQEALLVIYDRTACGEKWNYAIVAKHFNIPEGTVHAAWKRTLKPLLLKMADRIREMEEF
ncbi:hypothetical protein NWP21_00785 [Anabaenopsis sp. FSS-46]|uniref:hypothetical protein n=1 Tax=Anabaenopsis sp. FSS-46 TaxID=2971766 RepID=UPI0024754B3F|nr:hypothetical protein [Anabaenopsis sp. FSS-46]MDH6097403.1 hypothetical protein [Anabaenopsis sp. FSS-46]